jgi:hypothetical protein
MTKQALELFDALSYILECGLLGYHGELKTELNRLCESVLKTTAQDAPSDEICAMLLTARDCYWRNDYERGASELSRASRAWWRGALA